MRTTALASVLAGLIGLAGQADADRRKAAAWGRSEAERAPSQAPSQRAAAA